MEFAFTILLAYLLGSASGSLIVGRLRGGIDIRTQGSGNAGGTNALRTQGARFAAPVLVIDLAKGWIAVALLPSAAGAPPGEPPGWLPALCGMAAVVGHVLPVWHGFRGGKGVATLLGALAALAPVLLIPVILVWSVVVMSSGYVGLASVTASLALPVAALWMGVEPPWPGFAFALFGALLIPCTHRGNLARVMRGTESRAKRLWLFGNRSR